MYIKILLYIINNNILHTFTIIIVVDFYTCADHSGTQFWHIYLKIIYDIFALTCNFISV